MSVYGKQLLAAVAERVRAQRETLLDALVGVETYRTARTELDWTLAALEADERRTDWLDSRDPVGTVYASTPATMPMYSFVLFALSPAVVGNRVITRAASASRHCAQLMGDIVTDAGADVVMTAAPWSEFSARACTEADGVVFAGSAEHIQLLDERLPAQTQFIGQGPGVSATVVTTDADLQQAAETVIATRLFNSAQDCLATERVYVADSVYDAFVEALIGQADAITVGDNEEPETDLGPLLIPDAAKPWYSQLSDLGSVIRKGRQLDDGLYDLAILEAEADAPVVLEETFCPVLPIVRYSNTRQLQQMLSAGRFALSMTIFGDSQRTGTADFAHVAVNQAIYDFEDAWSPFGGYRHTTLVRGAHNRRSGPVLIPYELSRPRPGDGAETT
ncbi:aldehyde dehydrogenase family protein [Amycolatopsis palatopharyngis]|uniref:aldehyde dehydrogenase family protein n=1 Tax=Amycolatopsis palatopharyngis TaxID=187982 RepID=UPI000E240769|nr:aldehyde dehydrogenase family protein [Amycolatopsis palatopharyngis]